MYSPGDFEREDMEDLAARWMARDRGSSRREGRAAGLMRMLATIRHVFNGAIKKRLATRTPFKRHGVAMIEIMQEEGRSRGLEGDEEARLLAAADDPLTNDLIVVALETGARSGELTSLQWAQVRRDPAGVIRRIELVASKTKRGGRGRSR
jgi:integrase